MRALCHVPVFVAASMEESATRKDSDVTSKGMMGGGGQEEGQDYAPKFIGSKELKYYLQRMCRATSSQGEDNGLCSHGHPPSFSKHMKYQIMALNGNCMS